MSRVKDPRGVFTRYTVIQIQLSTEIHQLALCQWMKLQSHAFLTLPLRSLMRFIRFITLVKLAISSSLNDLCMKIKHNLFQSEWVENYLWRGWDIIYYNTKNLFSPASEILTERMRKRRERLAAQTQVAWAQSRKHCSHWDPLHSQFVLHTNKCIKYAEKGTRTNMQNAQQMYL